MPRIEIGVGLMLAALAPFGLFGEVWIAVVLVILGSVLIVQGGYEEWVKPRFRVDVRLTDWLLRRGWSVRVERRPQFNFILHLTSSSSGKEVVVTRDKATRDDLLAFTGKVPYQPDWFVQLPAMTPESRDTLISDVMIYLTAKNLSPNFNHLPDGSIAWPPVIVIQTALAQDSTLSQHSVDMTAKSVELALIGVRNIIRKAVLPMQDDRAESSPTPSPESTPDTEPPESQ